MSSPPDPTPRNPGEVEAFAQQARWLLEWHNKRNDGFIARAVGLLGFAGVILALLPRGLDLNGPLHMTVGLRASLIATTVLLLATAAFGILVLAPQQSGAPSVGQLREHWRDYANGSGPSSPVAQITEDLLHGTSVEADSPVDLAAREANRRARWFKYAAASLGLGLVALATLVIQVFWQA